MYKLINEWLLPRWPRRDRADTGAAWARIPNTGLYRNSQVDTISPELRDNIRESSRYTQDSRGEGTRSNENISPKVRKSEQGWVKESIQLDRMWMINTSK